MSGTFFNVFFPFTFVLHHSMLNEWILISELDKLVAFRFLVNDNQFKMLVVWTLLASRIFNAYLASHPPSCNFTFADISVCYDAFQCWDLLQNIIIIYMFKYKFPQHQVQNHISLISFRMIYSITKFLWYI